MPPTTTPSSSYDYTKLKGQALGRHVLLELRQCAQDILTDSDKLKTALVEAATEAGAHVVETVFHQFSPYGLSGVVVIAESHITVHTWPEYSYAAVDVFTCGNPEIAMRICNAVTQQFAAGEISSHVVDRGPNLPPAQ